MTEKASRGVKPNYGWLYRAKQALGDRGRFASRQRGRKIPRAASLVREQRFSNRFRKTLRQAIERLEDCPGGDTHAKKIVTRGRSLQVLHVHDGGRGFCRSIAYTPFHANFVTLANAAPHLFPGKKPTVHMFRDLERGLGWYTVWRKHMGRGIHISARMVACDECRAELEAQGRPVLRRGQRYREEEGVTRPRHVARARRKP